MANAAPAQCLGEPPAAGIELRVGEPGGAVDDGNLGGTDAARGRKASGVSAVKFAAFFARCGAS
jgi:hypothetical protein